MRYVITTLTGRSLVIAREVTTGWVCTDCGTSQDVMTLELMIGGRKWTQYTCGSCVKEDGTLKVIDLHKVEPSDLHCECPLNGSECCKCGEFRCAEPGAWAQRHNAEFVQRNMRYGFEF